MKRRLQAYKERTVFPHRILDADRMPALCIVLLAANNVTGLFVRMELCINIRLGLTLPETF